jgi:TAG lipase / steryl ester hydrolase / phospholipase A2 / LPA acyltransferase
LWDVAIEFWLPYITAYTLTFALLVFAILPRPWKRAIILSLGWFPWLFLSLISITVSWMVVLWTAFRIVLILIAFAFIKVLRGVVARCQSAASKLWRCRSVDGVSNVAGLYWLKRSIRDASDFEEWQAVADQIDQLEGKNAWKQSFDGEECDYAHIKTEIADLRRMRMEHDIRGLVYAMQKILTREHHNLNNPALFTKCMSGTKTLVTRYADEICATLEFIRDTEFCNDSFPISAKRAFFRDAKRSLGRTALCLSGGGALAMYHMGVIKTLLQRDCLPRIISGTSGGSIPAALVAIFRDDELRQLITPELSSLHSPLRWFDPVVHQAIHFFQHGVLMDSAKFAKTVHAFFGTYTFAEAFERTKRRCNISISLARRRGAKPHLLLLNHMTTPHVTVSSAVVASCALPGLMEPVELLAKTPAGKIEAWYPPGCSVRFVDGSLQGDIPRARLSELYNANQFIVSQVNPHVVPFVPDRRENLTESAEGDSNSNVLDRLLYMLHMDLRDSVAKLARLRLIPTIFFGQDISRVFQQRYTGCITISPKLSVIDFLKILSHPDVDDMRRYIDEGSRSCFPHIPRIEFAYRVERVLGNCVYQIETEMQEQGVGLAPIGRMARPFVTAESPHISATRTLADAADRSSDPSSLDLPSSYADIKGSGEALNQASITVSHSSTRESSTGPNTQHAPTSIMQEFVTEDGYIRLPPTPEPTQRKLYTRPWSSSSASLKQ